MKLRVWTKKVKYAPVLKLAYSVDGEMHSISIDYIVICSGGQRKRYYSIEITLKSMARCLLDYHQMVIRRSHLRIIILRTGSPRCVLHHLVKKAVDIMSGPKEASSYLDDLERAEYGIRVATKVYRCFLPLGWKYDRESASFFITGYDKIYTRKDGKKIIMRLAS